MGTTKKPRRKYRPKPVLSNPLGYVLESMTRVADHDFPLVDLKIKNHMAMTALLQGTAKRDDMDKLVALSNMTEALWELGFGKEYQNVCIDGRYAILSIANRATKHGRFTPTGPEITMLNTLMELHDAQMEVITVKDMEKALEALEEIALAGMSVAPEMIDSKEVFHARQAWRFIGIAARALEPVKKALAGQPEQDEPVAWLDDDGERVVTTKQKSGMHKSLQHSFPIPFIYAHPQAREPLPAHEIVTMYDECPTSDSDMIAFARAIEAAHGITGEKK